MTTKPKQISISKQRIRTSPSPSRHFMKEIVIKTEEPNVPQITILTTQSQAQNKFIKSIHSVEQLLRTLKLKRLHAGFVHISQCKYRANMTKIKARSMVQILNKKQQRLKSYGWLKILNCRSKYDSKLSICRLLNKISGNLISKMKLAGFLRLRIANLQRHNQPDSQPSKPQIAFSDSFLTACQKVKKFQPLTFYELSTNQFLPVLTQELKSIQQKRIHLSSESILHAINSHLMALKYATEEIPAEITKFDNQLKRNVETYKKLEMKEIKKIVEKQIKTFQPRKGNGLVDSRLFWSALVLKSLQLPLRLQKQIQELSQHSKQISSLQGLKVSLKKKYPSDKHDQWIMSIIDTLINLQQISQSKIKEEPQSEQYQNLLSQIESICSEMKKPQPSLQQKQNCQQLHQLSQSIQKLLTNRKIVPLYLKCLEKDDFSEAEPYTQQDIFQLLEEISSFHQKKHSQLEASLAQTKSKFEKKILSLNNKLKTSEDEKKQLRKEPMDEEMSELKQINEYLTQRITKLTAQMEKLLEQHQKKQQELSRTQSTLSHQSEELTMLKFKKEALEKELSIKEDMIRESSKKYMELDRSLSQEKDVKSKQIQEDSSSSIMKELQSQLQKLKRSEHTLEEINKDISSHSPQTQIERYKQILKEKNEEIAELRKQQEQHKNYDSLIGQISLKNEVIARLESKLKEEIQKRQSDKLMAIKPTESSIISLDSNIKGFEHKSKGELEKKVTQLSQELAYYKQTGMTSIDNVVVLLFNVLTKYVESSASTRQKEYIQKELTSIRNSSQTEELFFSNLQGFCVWFVTNDISSYRSHLQFQIERIYSFKLRVQELLAKQLTQAQQTLSVEYEFDNKTTPKTEYKTPTKSPLNRSAFS